MAQFARPTSDVVNTFAAGGWAAIDESTASDADFAYTADNTTGQLEVALSAVTDPAVETGHIVRVRLAKADTNVPPSTDGNTQTMAVALYEGATLRATIFSGAVGAWTTTAYTLTAGEANAITNYANLRIRIDSPASGGGPTGNRRGGAVSWAELEVPDQSANRSGALGAVSHASSTPGWARTKGGKGAAGAVSHSSAAAITGSRTAAGSFAESAASSTPGWAGNASAADDRTGTFAESASSSTSTAGAKDGTGSADAQAASSTSSTGEKGSAATFAESVASSTAGTGAKGMAGTFAAGASTSSTAATGAKGFAATFAATVASSTPGWTGDHAGTGSAAASAATSTSAFGSGGEAHAGSFTATASSSTSAAGSRSSAGTFAENAASSTNSTGAKGASATIAAGASSSTDAAATHSGKRAFYEAVEVGALASGDHAGYGVVALTIGAATDATGVEGLVFGRGRARSGLILAPAATGILPLATSGRREASAEVGIE